MKPEDLDMNRHYIENGKIVVGELFKEVGQVCSLLLGVLHKGVEAKYGVENSNSLVNDVCNALDGMEEELANLFGNDEEEAAGIMFMGMLLKLGRTLPADLVSKGEELYRQSLN